MRVLVPVLALSLPACAPPGEGPPLQTLEQAEELGAAAVARWPGAQLQFDWIQTVLGYGMHRLHVATGDRAPWQDHYRAWMRAHLPDFEGPDPRAFVSSDSLSPSLLASTLMVEDADEDLLAIAAAAHAYLADVPRTRQGAIVHWGPEHPLFGDTRQVWIDSQFMVGLFWLSEYDRTGERAHLDAAAEQYLLFSEVCRDPDTQLYFHAYDDETDANIPAEPTFWARGNSWVLISGVELLARTEPGDPAFDAIEPLWRRHLEAVLATQQPSGRFRTVLNSPLGGDPRNYEETSATALIGYAVARGRRAGLLFAGVEGEDPLARATEGVRGRITRADDGAPVLEGTSFGTNPGDYEYYVSVPLLDDQIVGVGAALMLLAEADGLASAAASGGAD